MIVARGWRAEGDAVLLEEQQGMFYLLGADGKVRDRWMGGLSSSQEWLYRESYTVDDGELVQHLDASGDGEDRPTKHEVKLRNLRALADEELTAQRARLARFLEGEALAAEAAEREAALARAEREGRFMTALDKLEGEPIDLLLEPEYDRAEPSPTWVVRVEGGAVIFRAARGFGKQELEWLAPIARERLGKRLRKFVPVLRTSQDDWNYFTD
jgi:hypothetical protein